MVIRNVSPTFTVVLSTLISPVGGLSIVVVVVVVEVVVAMVVDVVVVVVVVVAIWQYGEVVSHVSVPQLHAVEL